MNKDNNKTVKKNDNSDSKMNDGSSFTFIVFVFIFGCIAGSGLTYMLVISSISNNFGHRYDDFSVFCIDTINVTLNGWTVCTEQRAVCNNKLYDMSMQYRELETNITVSSMHIKSMNELIDSQNVLIEMYEDKK